jgi:hypothetical protein
MNLEEAKIKHPFFQVFLIWGAFFSNKCATKQDDRTKECDILHYPLSSVREMPNKINSPVL